MNYRNSNRSRSPFPALDRSLVLFAAFVAITAIILVKLFTLQVIAHDHYQTIAAREHYGYSELPAHRGEIYLKDYASGEKVRVATNSTLYLLYADPTMVKDKKLVTDRIVPFIYNLEEQRKIDEERVKTAILRAKTAEEIEAAKPLTDQQLYDQFYQQILEQISADIRQVVILSNEISSEEAERVRNLSLSGIEVTETNQLKAYPPQITDFRGTAQKLGEALLTPSLKMESLLRGRNRYEILKRQIPPDIAHQIKESISEDEGKNFVGLGLTEEYFRYYPEGQLAANVLGFVTPTGDGSYGIEAAFNNILKGKNGMFEAQKDSMQRLITVGDSMIEPAQDGQNVTLTIDRSIQMVLENKLARQVEAVKADSGQAIIMNPKTGAIIAMAHYPTFDPNAYSDIYQKEEIPLKPEEVAQLEPIEGMENTYWFYLDRNSDYRYMVFKKILADGTEVYEKYKNKVGPEAYQNKVVGAPYEPGSTFKAIVMSIAIDDQTVSPSTSINDSGVLKVDEYEIKNVSAHCTGRLNMTEVLINSCNTGMGWVAQKIGRSLFYSYLKKYGFGDRTEIEFDNEHPGQLSHFNTWADSELVTRAFGQGLTATMLQMVSAYSAIANNGVLMQPYIVDSVEKTPGNIIKTEPTVLGQVIRPETAETMTNMLVAVIENGVENKARSNTYYLAGKTGTSQTYKYGKPLTGAGTTLGSIGGFGPVDDPKFVMFIKMDRPRSSEWGGDTAGPVFREMAEYLMEYYSVPPDKK
jgi:cell division protein FtsI/penicillin-binding protein 2